MTDKLGLYNLALGHLEERKLASLTENREPRRVLDDYYDQELAYCLERKFWNFIYRTVSIDASRRSSRRSASVRLPHPQRLDPHAQALERGDARPAAAAGRRGGRLLVHQRHADLRPVQFQRHALRAEPRRLAGSFTDYVSKRLARQACKRITGSVELLQGPDGLIKQEEKAYKVAAANCAMNEAVGFAPQSLGARAPRLLLTAVGPGRRFADRRLAGAVDHGARALSALRAQSGRGLQAGAFARRPGAVAPCGRLSTQLGAVDRRRDEPAHRARPRRRDVRRQSDQAGAVRLLQARHRADRADAEHDADLGR
jgi:hypothetical protein